MPGPYEDDLRNVGRDDVASTLAARQSPVGFGLEQAGRSMASSPFSGMQATPALSAASMMPAGAVPPIGGAGGSNLAMPQARLGMMGAAPPLGVMPGMGMAPGMQQMPGMGQQRRRMY